MKDLDRGERDPHLDFLADQLVRHAVVMLGDLDVIVEADAAALPLGVFVGCGWQGSQGRPVELFEKRAPAGTPAAHWPVVQIVEQRSDRRIEFGQREEAPVPQPRQYPASDRLNADLDLGFIARLVGPRRDDRRAVMPRHVGVSPVDQQPWNEALMMPAFRLSLTVWRATPPKSVKARPCAAIQSGSFWLQVASA